MTLDEKVGQMCQYSGLSEESETWVREGKVGSFLNVVGAEATNKIQRIAVEETRLGIPLIFGLDVIHGYSTIFPIPLAMASSWDPGIVKRAASIAALESSSQGIHWTFAPMVDIARDPRWGRIAEGAGEDPFLGSAIARAMVEGFQGSDLADPNTIAACPKHYVAYGAAEGGRDYNTVDISERTLREVYLPPFKAAIVDAGACTVMSAFNDLNGIPASANRQTLTEVLRGEWGFDGFVVSDWNSVGELVNHGIAGTAAEAAKEAVTAGVDMDMCADAYRRSLARLVKERKLSIKVVDEAVRRILRIKFKLGIFERPYADPGRSKVVKSKENVEAALDAARRSIVLLKNEGNLLPLDKKISSIAVIGPLADDRYAPLGSWSCQGDPKDVVTVLEGIRSKVSAKTKVLHEKGCEVEGSSTEGFAEAVRIAKDSDVAIVVVGERGDMSGEAASRASLDLPGLQEELVKAVHGAGVKVVEVLMNGRPLSISWSAANVPAILEAWFLGVQAGNAIADVIFGDCNPGGRLPVTFPRTVGQVPIHYDHKATGRPPSEERWTSKYIDLPWTPLFPFGHGLSYTSFEYSGLKVERKGKGRAMEVKIALKVKNVGGREGDEVVQLYLRDAVASVTRPVKELKGFKRVTLKPGEVKEIDFALTPEQLSFLDRRLERVVEPGTFTVMVGASSEDIRLTGSFEVKERIAFSEGRRKASRRRGINQAR
ncbi:MAG: beta-glucosidase BglX [Candidatus Brockarchaeota archaeon]|nr:beta-glucosidase BglX [Candidatus Brockarchaeota archaeon]